MVELINLTGNHYHPDESFKGLEKLVLFPDGEQKRNGIPNGSVWVFDNSHQYDQRILADDAGCGMTALFLTDGIDVKKAANKIASHLGGKRVLGGGNHFVDICGQFKPSNDTKYPEHCMLVLHTDGKSFDSTIPTNIDEVNKKTQASSEFRKELGNDLAKLIGSKTLQVLGDWPHNTVSYESGKIVYRKGAVKVAPGKVYMLPVSVGSTIVFYTVHEDDLPMLSSMPHAAGRKGPVGEFKVSEEKAREVRKLVYVPDSINDSSLRSAHPSCFNDSSRIYRELGKQMISLGETKIKAFIGKI